MARIILSALVDEIRGKFNGDTIQTWRGITYRKKGTNPRQANSAPQSDIRQYWSYLSGQYDGLSAPYKANWDYYASLVKETWTGFNAFMGLNAVILYANYSTLSRLYDAPASAVSPAAPSGFSLSYNSLSDVFLAEWTTPAEPAYFVQAFFSPVTGYRDTLFPAWSFNQTVPSFLGYAYINAAQFVTGTQLRAHIRTLNMNGEVSAFSTTLTATKA